MSGVQRALRAAAGLALVGALGALPAPATAAGGFCSGGGVNVVVDFHELGGGAQRACDPSGAGQPASSVFPDAGYPLTYAQNQPGFVCRVSGVPSSEPCVNTPPPDAYWGLYWSDGKSGTWQYSSSGVGALKVGDGGFVAFSWQGSTTKSPPGIAPVNQQAEPSPSPRPSPKASTKHGSTTGTNAATGSTAPSGDGRTTTARPGSRHRGVVAAARRDRRQASALASPTASATPSSLASAVTSPGDGASPTAGQAVDVARPAGSGGLPGWVPVTLIAGLVAGTGATVLVRRRADGA